MYLHLGENVVVNEKDIIAIIDLENSTVSAHTKNFLKLAQKQNQVIDVSPELPKSAIICEKKDKKTVYISQISTSTLLKRADNNKLYIK